jgi:hypothetical protein
MWKNKVGPFFIPYTKVNSKQITGLCQWLTPITLATHEAEIRRIAVQSQPKQNSSQDPISKKPILKKDC